MRSAVTVVLVIGLISLGWEWMGRARLVHEAQKVMHSAVERLISRGLSNDELRRVFENELAQADAPERREGAVVDKP